MKKIIFIILFLIGFVSCNNVHHNLNIYNGMTKNELLDNYEIKINDFHDLDELLLVKFKDNIYVVKFDKKNKLENYEVVKMKNNIRKNRVEYSKSLDKIDFYDALSLFGFPEDVNEYENPVEYVLLFYINQKNVVGDTRTYLRIEFRYENEIFVNIFNQYNEDYIV